MCLLIVNPERRKIDRFILENARDANPDGFGFAYSEGNGVVAKKSSGSSDAAFRRFCAAIKAHRPQIIHFRLATHGSVCRKLSHPFTGHRWAMAHNGILGGISSTSDWESDTSILASMIRNSGRCPKEIEKELSEICGKGNKLGFVFDDASTLIINEAAGFWEGGIWHSNRSGVESPDWLWRVPKSHQKETQYEPVVDQYDFDTWR
jgi:hypothetical protein